MKSGLHILPIPKLMTTKIFPKSANASQII